MIISRSSALMKLHGFPGRYLLENKIVKSIDYSKRSHGGSWAYRKAPPKNDKALKYCERFGIFFWWWVTWHLITDYEELLPYQFPDPSKWTDEELGVPPI